MANSGSARMEYISGRYSLSGHDGHPTINWQLDVNSINKDTRKATINYQVVAGGDYWSGAQDGYAWIETGRTYINIAGNGFYIGRSQWYKGSTIKTGSFEIQYSEDGNYSFSIYGWSHVFVGDSIAAGYSDETARANVGINGSTTSKQTFTLDKVSFYSRAHNASGTATKYVYKTTDRGASWQKCNFYKTTNSGNNWSKVT